MKRWLLVLFALATSGCGDGSVDLFVDLRTDLVAGAEFARVETRIEGGPAVSEDAPTGRSYVAGRRVAVFRDLPRSPSLRLELRLLDASGALVVARPAFVAGDVADAAVTIVVTRDCRGVECPAGDDPAASACLDGRCAPEACLTGAEPDCPTPACVGADACDVADGCSTARCQDGACFREPDDGACGAAQRCEVGTGCVDAECTDPCRCGSGCDVSVDWVRVLGSRGDDEARGLSVHGDTLHAVGTFGGTTAGVAELTPTNGFDAFHLQLSAEGEPTTVRTVGGVSTQRLHGVAAGDDGVLLVGEYARELRMDDVALDNGGGIDGFALFLDGASVARSARSVVGGGASRILAAARNATRVVYGGEVDGETALLPAGPTGTREVMVAGRRDGFLVGEALDGASTWSLAFGSMQFDEIAAVALAEDGVVVACGAHDGALTVGGVPVPNAGGRDALVMALTSDGELRWVRAFGGAFAADECHAVAVGPAGVLIAGSFGGEVAFDAHEARGVGEADAFVALLSVDDGTVEWVETFGSPTVDAAEAVSFDADGHVLVALSVRGALDGEPEIAFEGDVDALFVSLDAAGRRRWVFPVTGRGQEIPAAVVAAPGSGAYAAGSFTGTVTTGLGGRVSQGARDAFVVRLSVSPRP